MSNGNSGFGPSVIGHEAYDKAVRNEQGGGNVFGTRVRGAITEDGPTNAAKRVSEFGVRVVRDATGSDEQGNVTDTVSIDSLRNILAENPTFLDSLYEAELAREDGARPDALGIFYEVERGIKGQMRPDVMSEMRTLMGQKGIDADALANQAQVRIEQDDQMQKRTEENALLGDADRVKALKERNENINAVKQAQDEGNLSVQVAATTEGQEQQIAARRGLTMPGQEQANATGSVPTKPDGDTNVETQQPGERLGVPKGTSGTDSEGSGQEGSSPSEGAGSDRKAKAEEFRSSLREYPKDRLEADLRKALGDEKVDAIEGSGSSGAVVKEDLATLAATSIEDGSVTTNRSGYIVASS